MDAAVLSCGPSLYLYDEDFAEDYEIIIGVNSAVEKHVCDVWCFSDHNVFHRYTPREPFPWGIFTCGSLKPKFTEFDERKGDLVTTWFDEKKYETAMRCRFWDKRDYEFNFFEGFGDSSRDIWKRFTIASALLLAYMMGAKKIDVYGHDMEGEEDWKGEPGRRTSDRDEHRWKLERETWDLVTDWIKKRGVRVERILECRTAPSA